MKKNTNDVISRDSIFIWIAVATAAILLIPLIAMQFTTEVSWDEIDFIVMGMLIFGISSLFVLVARKVPRKRRLLVGGIFFLAFLYIWVELAVGVFTNLGS